MCVTKQNIVDFSLLLNILITVYEDIKCRYLNHFCKTNLVMRRLIRCVLTVEDVPVVHTLWDKAGQQAVQSVLHVHTNAPTGSRVPQHTDVLAQLHTNTVSAKQAANEVTFNDASGKVGIWNGKTQCKEVWTVQRLQSNIPVYVVLVMAQNFKFTFYRSCLSSIHRL